MQEFELLEKEIAEWSGFPHVVAVSSGTTALHLALEAMQLPQGSTVVLPEFTMVACARAATLAGLCPTFVDCGDDLLMSPHHVGDDLFRKTSSIRAIMPVHIYGRQCDMEHIVKFAKINRIKVIEDLAEAHGISPHPETDAGCWSFYKNKIVHGEEGGAIGFRDKAVADYARSLRSLGFTENHDFSHLPRGINGRMSNMHAVPIRESLKNIEYNLVIRRNLAAEYDRLLPDQFRMPQRQVNWVYDLRISGMLELSQSNVVRYCREEGVEARHAFKPMSRQPEYSDKKFGLNALRLSRDIVYLPLNDQMTYDDVRHNVMIFMEACQRSGLI